MKKYGNFTTKDLLDAILNNQDKEALVYLLNVTYKGMMVNNYKSLIRNDSYYTIENYISDLYSFLYESDENPFRRLRGVNNVDTFSGWLKITSKNYLIDLLRKNKREIVTSELSDDVYNNISSQDDNEKPFDTYVAIKLLENIDKEYKVEDKLIMFSHLIDRYKGTHSAEYVAQCLKINNGAYRTKKSRLFSKYVNDLEKILKQYKEGGQYDIC